MDKKILKIAIVLVLILGVCATLVNASSFTCTMTPSSTTVAESTEFTIKVKVSNLDVGSNGINALSGYIKYDNSVFEAISSGSIEGLNQWNANYSEQNAGKITLTKTTFVKTEDDVFQITFKTLAGTAGKSGTIQFTNIVASNSEQEISASDISTTITIGEANNNNAGTTGTTGNAINPNGTSTGSGNGNTLIVSNTGNNGAKNTSIVQNGANNGTTTGGNGVTINSNGTNNANGTNAVSSTVNGTGNSSSYINSQNSSADGDMPYTGVEDTIKIVIGVAMIIAIVFYIKFERINKAMK